MRFTVRFLFGALTAVVSGSLLYAQHAGSHASASAGFHTGASGFHTGGSGVYPTSPGVHFGNPGFGNLNSLPPPASGISPLAWRQMQRSNHLGYGNAGYGAFFAPSYYPFLGYADSGFTGSSYDAPPPEDAGSQSATAAEAALSRQVQILSDQLEQLKDSQQRSAIPANNDVQETTPHVPITIVLRNGQQLQVQNYAVMDRTFWDFSRQPVRKIPVSSIDIGASTRATEATGGEFPKLDGTP
jgi:hypothetical protein